MRKRAFSAETGKWVHNVVMDYTKHSPEEVWEKACEVVKEKMQDCGWRGKISIGLLWISPPCHTYSPSQIINFDKGRAYRDHRTKNKDLVKGRSK